MSLVLDAAGLLALEAGDRQLVALLASSRTSDVVDAAVVLIADPADRILTSDPDDIEHLARAAGADVEVVTV